MKRIAEMSFPEKIRWRIRLLWGFLIAMLIYMVAIGELGGGDSRIMTPLAESASRTIFFGGLIYVGYRIRYNKKLLRDRQKLQAQKMKEQDERNQYLHDKSGGLVMDVLLVLLLMAACTAALFDMSAFYMAYGILAAAVLLKGIAYYGACKGWI